MEYKLRNRRRLQEISGIVTRRVTTRRLFELVFLAASSANSLKLDGNGGVSQSRRWRFCKIPSEGTSCGPL
jgi:hypothetical protein